MSSSGVYVDLTDGDAILKSYIFSKDFKFPPKNHLIDILFSVFFSASSVVSSYGPTSATREHEKRILETILPPDLRHLVHGNSSTALHVNTYIFLLCTVG